ncbi:hypothetical protein [Emticicia fontis]
MELRTIFIYTIILNNVFFIKLILKIDNRSYHNPHHQQATNEQGPYFFAIIQALLSGVNKNIAQGFRQKVFERSFNLNENVIRVIFHAKLCMGANKPLSQEADLG